MNTQSCVRKLKMTLDEWHNLERLAIATSSHNMSGQRVRQPSWLALLRRIARGELLVVEPESHRLNLARVDAAIAKNEAAAQEAHARRVQAEFKQLSMMEMEAEPA